MIEKILVAGGTHGNELTGVTIINNWASLKSRLAIETYEFAIQPMLMNKGAIDARQRYIEQDLNRQFSSKSLEKNINREDLATEEYLAKQLNDQIGPKHLPQFDLLIDFHNTTSHLGPCLIILTTNDFEMQLVRYVKFVMPEAVILLENEKSYDEFPYLCTLGKHGIMLELGAQAHGVNSPNVFENGLTLLKAVLDFCDNWNKKQLPDLPPIEAFHLTGDIKYPELELGTVLIHPDLYGKDFMPLHKGSPCFLCMDGKDILWEQETTYPHFIGEVAYQHLGLAFSTSDKITL